MNLRHHQNDSLLHTLVDTEEYLFEMWLEQESPRSPDLFCTILNVRYEIEDITGEMFKPRRSRDHLDVESEAVH
jgi:hypothetical protein